MERISNRTNNENNDSTEYPPPPPYATVVYKIDDYDFDTNPPPDYLDVDTQSVVYINNYPGPPLTDGQVQGVRNNTSVNHENLISRKVCIYLLLNGLITILFGFAAIGLQIGIVVSNSITYYYYGFWGGAVLLSTGLSTAVLYNHHYRIDYLKLFHSFFWQMMIAAVLFGIGIVIIITDTCDDNSADNGSQCKNSYKILNGFLLGIFGLALLQSGLNACVFGILKRRYRIVSNTFS